MTNNPAARLHLILSTCREKEKALKNKPMVEAWRTIFGISPEVQDSIVMSKVGLVYMLPPQISAKINSISDINHRLYLGWQNELAQAFGQISFQAPFQNFTSKLSDSLLLSIEFCADLLSKTCPEKVIDKKQMEQLRNEISELYTNILNSDLDPDLAQYLLDQLQLIIDAIDNYMLTGSLALEKAIDTIIGATITKNYRARSTKDSKFGNPFWAIVGKTAVLLELAKSAAELGEGIIKLLPTK